MPIEPQDRHPLWNIRRCTGLSQRAFAELVGLPSGLVANIEAGRHDCSRENAYKIALETGCSPLHLEVGTGAADLGGMPFTPEAYRVWRAQLKAPVDKQLVGYTAYSAMQLIQALLFAVGDHSSTQGEMNKFLLKLSAAIEDLYMFPMSWHGTGIGEWAPSADALKQYLKILGKEQFVKRGKVVRFETRDPDETFTGLTIQELVSIPGVISHFTKAEEEFIRLVELAKTPGQRFTCKRWDCATHWFDLLSLWSSSETGGKAELRIGPPPSSTGSIFEVFAEPLPADPAPPQPSPKKRKPRAFEK